MEYREQLKYIKSHQKEKYKSNNKRAGKKNNNKKKSRNSSQPKRISGVNRILFRIQVCATVFFMVSIIVLGIFPEAYMIAFAVILLFLLVVVKAFQIRAGKSVKRRSSAKGLSVFISILLIVAAFYALKVNLALHKIAVGETDGEHAYSVTEEPFNIYISGIDVYGDITKESRSDVNLIATVNPNTQKILLTTTPRDYYVTIPGVSGEQRDKLTHAGTYGVGTSMATLENLYDTDIPFYIRVNFTSVEEIVDVMGGVDVESELAFTTGKEAGDIVDVKEGMNHFNGKQALAFVRERKALATGDNQRGKNQQALLSAMIKQAVSPMIVFHANSMISSVAGNAETNLSEAQIKSLIRMQISRMKGWDIESVAAEGDDSGKQYCYSYSQAPLYVTVPYESSVSEIREKIRNMLGK